MIDKKFLITLCARGGSKGIPKKNIKLLNGRPLIDYSIRFSKELAKLYNCDIELSTDDDEIIAVAKTCGLDSLYKRPEILASDTSGKVDAIRDILVYSEKKNSKIYDFIIDLDITSPLRTIDDVVQAIDLMNNDSKALTLFSVSKANKNPYFNMVEQSSSGYFSISKKIDTLTLSRQTAPFVYELNASFYIYNREFFNKDLKGVITERSLIYEMNHICFDVDHLIDFEFMEYLIMKDKIDFELI